MAISPKIILYNDCKKYPEMVGLDKRHYQQTGTIP
jgi:hypothetical protein